MKKSVPSFLINLEQHETMGLLIFQRAFCKIMRLFINIQKAKRGPVAMAVSIETLGQNGGSAAGAWASPATQPGRQGPAWEPGAWGLGRARLGHFAWSPGGMEGFQG